MHVFVCTCETHALYAHHASPFNAAACMLNVICTISAPTIIHLLTASICHVVVQDLEAHVYGNPHSLHGELLGEWGSGAAETEARRLTMQMCSASAQDYVCIFTAGATGDVSLSCFVLRLVQVMRRPSAACLHSKWQLLALKCKAVQQIMLGQRHSRQ